jgi:hypothetical protein
MKSPAPILATLALLGLTLPLTACALDADEDVSLDETTSELSTSNWSPPSNIGQHGWYGGSMATLNGTTYMVHSGIETFSNLWWTKLVNGQWTANRQVTGQSSSRRTKLAAYNGTLYLFHSGNSTPNDVWVSRFNPSNETWNTNFKLSFQSKGAPAIASYNGLLYIVGVNPSTNQLFMSTMNAFEQFTAPVAMGGHYSSTPVSLAVHNSRLYMTHRAGTTTGIVVNYFNGSTWQPDLYINQNGNEPSIASHDGFLHLVYNAGNRVTWTYATDGASFSAPVTIGSLTSAQEPVIVKGGSGLVLLTVSHMRSAGCSLLCYPAEAPLVTSQYTSPTLPPIDLPPGEIGP